MCVFFPIEIFYFILSPIGSFLNFALSFIVLIYYLTYVREICVNAQVPLHVYGDRRTTLQSPFSPSTFIE